MAARPAALPARRLGGRPPRPPRGGAALPRRVSPAPARRSRQPRRDAENGRGSPAAAVSAPGRGEGTGAARAALGSRAEPALRGAAAAEKMAVGLGPGAAPQGAAARLAESRAARAVLGEAAPRAPGQRRQRAEGRSRRPAGFPRGAAGRPCRPQGVGARCFPVGGAHRTPAAAPGSPGRRAPESVRKASAHRAPS